MTAFSAALLPLAARTRPTCASETPAASRPVVVAGRHWGALSSRLLQEPPSFVLRCSCFSTSAA